LTRNEPALINVEYSSCADERVADCPSIVRKLRPSNKGAQEPGGSDPITWTAIQASTNLRATSTAAIPSADRNTRAPTMMAPFFVTPVATLYSAYPSNR